jgi:hypothetical protein
MGRLASGLCGGMYEMREYDKSKLCRLSNVIDSAKPDIIIGTETWLDKDIRDSEICPRGYVLHRKDRTNKTGGGVLLAIQNEYNSEHVPELDTDCWFLF